MAHEKWYYRHLNNSQKIYLDHFTKKLFNNLQMITNAIYKELSVGYDEMVKKDRDDYYNSDFYKQARKKQIQKATQNMGGNIGLNDMKEKLGHWIPTKRNTGDKHHITYSRTPEHDELAYIPIPLKEYVYEKAIVIAKKYSDLTTLTGLVFQMLTERECQYRASKEFEWFCYKNYKEDDFCVSKHIPELLDLFPESMRSVLSHIDCGPTVQENSTVIVRIRQNGQLSSFKINTKKFPIQKHIVGKEVGDSFKLPNINLDYLIERIY